MTPELARVLERVRQTRAARAADVGARTAVPSAAAGALGQRFAVGARAFDLVTGWEGEVIGSGSENVLVPAPQQSND